MSVDHPHAKTTLFSVSKADNTQHATPGRLLMSQLLGDIAAGTARLPSPDQRVAKLIQHGTSKAAQKRRIARLLSADPALSAKTLRASCGSAQLQRPRSLPQAVERLDRHYLNGLIAAASESGISYDRNPILRQAARGIWQQALRVSTLSYLLASLDGRFDPEEAALAGLLHNLGDVALLGRASQSKHESLENELSEACRIYGADAGGALARSWGFPASLVRVMTTRGDWYRDQDGPADMADLVLIAQLHAALGKSGAENLPRLQTIPAFSRLDLGQVTPRFSLDLLEAANNALALTRRQLNRL